MQIAIIIAHKNFRDEEYFIPREILEEGGVRVETFSNEEGVAYGSEGGEVETHSIDDLNPDDYEGAVLVGGSGALKHLNNSEIHKLINEFEKKNKIVSAICISPVILAAAGVLQNKKATVWTSNMDKSAIKKIEKGGAVFVEESVVRDGNVITADGPEAAEEFGNVVIEALKQNS